MSLSRAEVEAMDRDELIETIVGMRDTVDDLHLSVDVLIDRLADAEERIDELEAETDRLRERAASSDGKADKVAQIVRAALNIRDDKPAVKLDAQNIQTATGCSRRYAYDLMDDLPDEYDWALTPDEMSQYGSLEIDNGGRRLGVDIEGVHSRGCPVNKFTTGDGRGGGQR